MSESLSSKSNAEPQMLQCYKDYLNLKRKMTENMEASEENFKERISKVNKTIEGIGTAITQSVQLLSELVKVRQNPATCQFPQEIFHNMNSCITNQNGLASPPLNYASYAAGSNLSSESYLEFPYDRSFSNFNTPRKDHLKSSIHITEKK